MAIILNDSAGIKYTNISLPGATTGNKRANSPYQDKITGNAASARSTTEISEPSQRFINTIDIDWNGAEITSTAFPAMNTTNNVINTTGDLLSWIKEGIEEAAKTGRTSGVVRRSLWIN